MRQGGKRRQTGRKPPHSCDVAAAAIPMRPGVVDGTGRLVVQHIVRVLDHDRRNVSYIPSTTITATEHPNDPICPAPFHRGCELVKVQKVYQVGRRSAAETR